MPRATQQKRYTVTWNNYSDETVQHLKDLYTAGILRYIVAGKEVAPKTGTLHLQIYLETTKKCTMKAVISLMNKNHVEIAGGDSKVNIDYCSKENDVVLNLGKPLTQGARTDIDDLYQDIKDGLTYEDLFEKHFKLMLQYRKGVEEFLNIRDTRDRNMPNVRIFWGKTGTGKTMGAYEHARSLGVVLFAYPGGGWYNGYRGQKVVLFDEFHGAKHQGLPFDKWKQICDRYPLQVPTKGGFMAFAPDDIFFTSNISPRNWWPDEVKPADWWEQFERRITEIKEFN